MKDRTKNTGSFQVKNVPRDFPLMPQVSWRLQLWNFCLNFCLISSSSLRARFVVPYLMQRLRTFQVFLFTSKVCKRSDFIGFTLSYFSCYNSCYTAKFLFHSPSKMSISDSLSIVSETSIVLCNAQTIELFCFSLQVFLSYQWFSEFYVSSRLLDARTANDDVATEASSCLFLSSFCAINLSIIVFIVHISLWR